MVVRAAYVVPSNFMANTEGVHAYIDLTSTINVNHYVYLHPSKSPS